MPGLDPGIRAPSGCVGVDGRVKSGHPR